MAGVRLGDMLAALGSVDDGDVVERASRDAALRTALEMARPRNWWGTEASQDLLMIARAEGLPLAWVPRPDIVRKLNEAADQTQRDAILLSHSAELLDDCSDVLGECSDPWVGDNVTVARQALDAIRAGHHAAGMALAVAIGEPLAAWASTPRVQAFDSREDQKEWNAKRAKSKYGWAQIEIDRAGSGQIEAWDFRYQVLIAPIPRFFTPWRPEWGPAPERLSRHVVAHQAPPDHFSLHNALLALMLTVGVLREQQEWSQEVRHDGM